MSEWWNNLSGLAQFFWSIAIVATLLQAFFFIASLVGGGDFDHDTEIGPGDSDVPHDASHGVKVLSVRALVAFGVGFGWAGALALAGGWPVFLSSLTALGFGVVFVFVIYFIMRFLVAMQDPGGGLDYWNAVGREGHVYFTIPGARGGEGQIEVMLQGRLVTASAVTEHPDPIPPRAPVLVLAVEGESLLVVEPANTRDHLKPISP